MCNNEVIALPIAVVLKTLGTLTSLETLLLDLSTRLNKRNLLKFRSDMFCLITLFFFIARCLLSWSTAESAKEMSKTTHITRLLHRKELPELTNLVRCEGIPLWSLPDRRSMSYAEKIIHTGVTLTMTLKGERMSG